MYLIWLFVLWFKEDTKHNVQPVLALFSICLDNDNTLLISSLVIQIIPPKNLLL